MTESSLTPIASFNHGNPIQLSSQFLPFGGPQSRSPAAHEWSSSRETEKGRSALVVDDVSDVTEMLSVLLTTGYSMFDDRNRSLTAGFNEHVTKPIDPRAFLELIEQL